jgi:hypothetical protein
MITNIRHSGKYKTMERVKWSVVTRSCEKRWTFKPVELFYVIQNCWIMCGGGRSEATWNFVLFKKFCCESKTALISKAY